MYNSTPLHFDALDTKLREALAPLGVKFEESSDGIRDIAVVGGLFLGTELFPHDMEMLIDILGRLRQAGIKIRADCRFWIYNLSMGSDFLNAAQNIASDSNNRFPKNMDLVISAFIFNGHSSSQNDFVTGVSPRHREPDIWAKNARALNARIIVTHGGPAEVGIEFFTGNGTYRHIPQADHHCASLIKGSDYTYAYAVREDERLLAELLSALKPEFKQTAQWQIGTQQAQPS